MSGPEPPLLAVEDLRVHYPGPAGLFGRPRASVRAVDGVSFTIPRGETLGLVGESGCGKTSVARAVLQIVRPTSGRVVLDGVELTTLAGEALRQARRRMQMIFQDPYASLNPRLRVGRSAAEPLAAFGLARGAELDRRVRELFERVGLPAAAMRRFPHQLSGGERQRVGIARALALQPDLVICDEPVAALDVSIRAQVVNLLADLQHRFGLTYLFIAHDLGVVRHVCDRVAVMYLGRLVETASSAALYSRPLHPYTQALLAAMPVPDPAAARAGGRRALEGELPDPADPPSGCRFRTRCPLAEEVCARREPELLEITPGHRVACHLVEPATGDGAAGH